jgi:aminoglycoside phosphotransferase (APT) family kinase protein
MDQDLTRWPSAVRQVVDDLVGPSLRSERLSGLSGREVRLVRGDLGSVVVKAGAHPRELAFYVDVAPSLAGHGVAVPDLLWHGTTQDRAWLVLEHVPSPLPRDRWSADAGVYDVLAGLHSATTAYHRLDDPFVPQWTDQLTEAAAAQFDGRTAAVLTQLQEEAAPYLSGTSCLSGDPNPRNWVVRDDGTLVLLDWERAGLGGPAVDVGIALPGLPDRAESAAASAAYLAAHARRGSDPGLEEGDLARRLLVVKAWTAVELLAEERRHPELDATQDWLADALPAWVRSWR